MSSNIRVKRICQHCEKEFTAKTTVTRYCGDRCSKRAYKARKKAEKLNAVTQESRKQVSKPIHELQLKEFLSGKETCQLFGISRTTLWRLIKQGKLKQANIGKRIIIRKSELQNLFN
jgi:excisionase family DNA binding protein